MKKLILVIILGWIYNVSTYSASLFDKLYDDDMGGVAFAPKRGDIGTSHWAIFTNYSAGTHIMFHLRTHGQLSDYTYNNQPWYQWIKDLDRIYVEAQYNDFDRSNIPDKLGAYMCYGSSASVIDIRGNIGTICDYAFADMSNCNAIELLCTIESMGDGVFYETNPDTVYIVDPEPPIVTDHTFSGHDQNCVLVVPKESLDKYKLAKGWKDYSQIIPDEAGDVGESIEWSFDNGTLSLSGIGDTYDFDEESVPWDSIKNSINHIVVGNGITGIGKYIFADLPNLSSVDLPNTLKGIHDYSFYNCNKLRSITIPENCYFVGVGSLFISEIKEIINLREVPNVNFGEIFDSIQKPNIILYVPAKNQYEDNPLWKVGTIRNLSEYENHVHGVKILNTEYGCARGDQFTINYELSKGSSVIDTSVVFLSSDTALATVDSLGVVSTKLSGEVTIYVITNDDKFIDYIDISIGKSMNNNLSSLSCNYEYTPDFDPNITDYYCAVPYNYNLKLVGVPADELYGKVEYNSNIITVIAESGITKQYIMHVYRKSNDVGLKSLNIPTGSLEPGFTINYTGDYIWKNHNGKYPTWSVHEKASSNIYTEDDYICIKVTAEDTLYSRTYKIKLITYSDNAYLLDLNVSGYTLEPEFHDQTFKYKCKIPNDCREVVINASPNTYNSTVTYNKYQQVLGNPMMINIDVLSESKSVRKTYYITFYSDKITTGLDKVSNKNDEILIHNAGLYKIYLDSNGNKVLK